MRLAALPAQHISALTTVDCKLIEIEVVHQAEHGFTRSATKITRTRFHPFFLPSPPVLPRSSSCSLRCIELILELKPFAQHRHDITQILQPDGSGANDLRLHVPIRSGKHSEFEDSCVVISAQDNLGSSFEMSLRTVTSIFDANINRDGNCLTGRSSGHSRKRSLSFLVIKVCKFHSPTNPPGSHNKKGTLRSKESLLADYQSSAAQALYICTNSGEASQYLATPSGACSRSPGSAIR